LYSLPNKRISVTIDIRTRTIAAEQQETITRDSVTIKVNAVLWYRIVDAAKSVIKSRMRRPLYINWR
jgi:regulator of protease activity HflC (stomatin/prohibitin superfamily)